MPSEAPDYALDISICPGKQPVMHGPLRAVCPHVLALHHLAMSPLGEHDAAIQSVFFTPQEQILHLQIESSCIVVAPFQVLLVREKNYFSILGCNWMRCSTKPQQWDINFCP